MSYRENINKTAEDILAEYVKKFGSEPRGNLRNIFLLYANGTIEAYEEGFQDGLNAARTQENI